MKEKSNFFDAKTILHSLLAIALAVNIGLLFSISDDESGSTSAAGSLEVFLLTTPECDSCFDLDPLEEFLVKSGVEPASIESFAYDSKEGKKLVKRYEVKEVPTAILMGDVSINADLQELVAAITEERDGAYVVTKVQPPYLDLEQNKIRGDFNVVLIDDESCEECYDVTEHEIVFERLVMEPSAYETVDISTEEGKLLLDEYNIVAVPTILLRGDLEVYDQLVDVWAEAGSVEEDGTWVLRSGVETMGTYKSLPDGEIVTPEQEPPAGN